MFDKRLKNKVETLQENMGDLTKRVWLLENPPKFKVGDKVVYENLYMFSDPVSLPCEITGTNPNPKDAYREYYVKFDTDELHSIPENRLKPNN